MDIIGPLNPAYYADEIVGLRSTPAGNHSIQQSGYQLSGFPCGDGTYGDGNVVITYPELEGMKKYPIVSFMHGSGNGFFWRSLLQHCFSWYCCGCSE